MSSNSTKCAGCAYFYVGEPGYFEMRSHPEQKTIQYIDLEMGSLKRNKTGVERDCSGCCNLVVKHQYPIRYFKTKDDREDFEQLDLTAFDSRASGRKKELKRISDLAKTFDRDDLTL